MTALQVMARVSTASALASHIALEQGADILLREELAREHGLGKEAPKAARAPTTMISYMCSSSALRLPVFPLVSPARDMSFSTTSPSAPSCAAGHAAPG